jgi:hypothetical protein
MDLWCVLYYTCTTWYNEDIDISFVLNPKIVGREFRVKDSRFALRC